MSLTDETKMTFGKYKGKALANVPADYLLWWYDQNKPLMDYIDYNRDVLEHQVKNKN